MCDKMLHMIHLIFRKFINITLVGRYFLIELKSGASDQLCHLGERKDVTHCIVQAGWYVGRYSN